LQTYPAAGDIIYWTLFRTNTTVNYSVISKETFTADGIETEFNLLSAPFYAVPTAYNVMVKVGNRILKSWI